MKTLKYSFVGVLLILLIAGCEDYSASSSSVSSVELTSTKSVSSGIQAVFLITAEAAQVVVWWGDEGSNYDEYQSLLSNPGTEENLTFTYPKAKLLTDNTTWDGSTPISHIYESAGDYKVVVIASSAGDFSEDIQQVVFERTFTIAEP